MHTVASKKRITSSGAVGAVCALPLLVLLLALVACRAEPSSRATSTARMLTKAEVSAGAGLLHTTAWLADHLDDPAVVVLHVDRDRRGYDEAHVPGAHFLSLDRIAVEREVPAELPSIDDLDSAFESAGVSDGSRVVLYGGMGGLAAARAFFTLDVLGHGDHAALLDGGVETWKREGRPVSSTSSERSSSATTVGTLTPRPQLDRLVDADWVSARLGDPSVLLIDLRRPAEFRGEEDGSRHARQGHIPGAKNLYWEDFFADRETRRLHDRETLRAMFERVGARPGRTNVTYCTVGMRASFGYFVSRYLGYDTKMYDGSFTDWSRRENLPVER